MYADSRWRKVLDHLLSPEDESYKVETGQNAWGSQQAFQPSRAAPQSSNIFQDMHDKGGQVILAANDHVAKKRRIDKAYRERCKKNQMENERNLELLRKENDLLKEENEFFKTEAVRTRQTLQSQEEEMNRLRKTIAQLKEKHDKQNTIVDVLSKRLAGAYDTDLQCENARLKREIAMLRSQFNDRNNLDKLQLQEKSAQLEHDKRSLEVIVQALCEKINNEKGHELDQGS